MKIDAEEGGEEALLLAVFIVNIVKIGVKSGSITYKS